MIRSSVLAAAAILALLLPVACDKAADDQAKVNNAQAEANAKIDAAMTEAAAKMNGAQADADRKIAEAQASFSKMREDFRHSMTTDLVKLDKNIADLDAKTKTTVGKVKTDLDANLKIIRAKRDHLSTELAGLDGAAASTWDAAKASIDKDFTELKTLVDKS